MWLWSSGSRRSSRGGGSLMRSRCMIVSMASEPLARANIARPLGSPASDEVGARFFASRMRSHFPPPLAASRITIRANSPKSSPILSFRHVFKSDRIASCTFQRRSYRFLHFPKAIVSLLALFKGDRIASCTFQTRSYPFLRVSKAIVSLLALFKSDRIASLTYS